MLLIGGCVGRIAESDNIELSGVAVCSAERARPASAPIRRFTPLEYNRTVRQLFPELTLRQQLLAADPKVDGFDNNALAQSPSPLLVEQIRNAAIEVAAAAVTGLDTWAPCPASEGRACAVQIAQSLSERAYRRPLTTEERDQLSAFAGAAFDDFGFDVAARMTVEAILQTPDFLYKPELGDEGRASSGMIPLTGFELATRLSYFLWGTAPDTALLDAARDGQLDTAEGLRAQAERMLDAPQAKEAVAHFHAQWFRLEGLANFQPDAERFGAYTDAVRDAVIESTPRFLDYVFWDVGTAHALFSDPTIFVNDAMAAAYDLPSPGSDTLQPVQAPTSERAGILTQPGLLASTSHPRQHSPIKRGVFVRAAVLCAPLPPPPANVSTVLEDPPPDRPRTTREHIEETHVSGDCAGCHDAIDGIGFSFENYDAMGRYVTEEYGLPVDPRGALIGIPGISEGEVANAIELTRLISTAQQTRTCIARQWFRYALGRSTNDDASRCQVDRLGAELAQGDGDLHAMLMQLITSDHFRFLPAN